MGSRGRLITRQRGGSILLSNDDQSQDNQNQNNNQSQNNNQNPVNNIDDWRKLSLADAAQFAYNASANFDNYNASSLGMNSYNELQALVEALNMHDKPIVLSDADYDAQYKANALNGVELYRGLGRDPSGKYQQQFLYGDKTFIGDGVHGQGIYMTTSSNYAVSYAGGSVSQETVTAFIDKSKAKVINEQTLDNKWSTLSNTDRRRFGSAANYALYLGYNTVHAVGGNHGANYAYGKGSQRNGYMDFYLPLTREILVCREHSRLH